jgi:uncharacterized protein (DUF1697 family)
MTTFVALLRGINVGGKNKIPMADLRQLYENLGCNTVRTYIQSGNVVFEASEDATTIETNLERGIKKKFGHTIPVIVRSAKQWHGYLKANPFAAATCEKPEHVLVGLSKLPMAKSAQSLLRERASSGELVEVGGGALWIFYANGVARSKLSPAVIDRAVGSSVTARNWRTVEQLAVMIEQSTEGKTK